jgi:hypothetical protein
VLVEPGTALEVGLALVGRVVAYAPVAVSESRKVVLNSSASDYQGLSRQSVDGFVRVARTEDFPEGSPTSSRSVGGLQGK